MVLPVCQSRAIDLVLPDSNSLAYITLFDPGLILMSQIKYRK